MILSQRNKLLIWKKCGHIFGFSSSISEFRVSLSGHTKLGRHLKTNKNKNKRVRGILEP